MYFNKSHRPIDIFPGLSKKFADRLAELGPNIWDNFETQRRQKIWHKMHSKPSVYLIRNYMDNYDLSTNYIVDENYESMKDLLEPLLQSVIDGLGYEYEEGEMAYCRFLFSHLEGNGRRINKHTDTGYTFAIAHRMVLPIILNPKCVFHSYETIDGVDILETLPLEEDHLIELNNKVPHDTVNKGSTARVHLLFDIVVPRKRFNEVIKFRPVETWEEYEPGKFRNIYQA